MTTNEREIIMDTVDMLRLLGGNNGFSNLQPKIRKELLKRSNELKAIVDRDISGIREGTALDKLVHGKRKEGGADISYQDVLRYNQESGITEEIVDDARDEEGGDADGT